MKIRPYLTYQGDCQEAIDLYSRAFHIQPLKILRFGDMPNGGEGSEIPPEMNNCILQCTMELGDDFIRMSDCMEKLNDPESERVSIAVEGSEEEVKHAFDVLSEEGRVAAPLEATFYSPSAGVVFDKFGVMWNFVAQKE